MNVQSDRAEQAKALIERLSPLAYEEWIEDNGKVIERAEAIELLAAALTASEAEVTRLETGIAEALAMGASGERWWEMHEFLSELSQPTTDTNGAEMCSLPECPYVHPANTAHFRGEHREDR